MQRSAKETQQRKIFSLIFTICTSLILVSSLLVLDVVYCFGWKNGSEAQRLSRHRFCTSAYKLWHGNTNTNTNFHGVLVCLPPLTISLDITMSLLLPCSDITWKQHPLNHFLSTLNHSSTRENKNNINLMLYGSSLQASHFVYSATTNIHYVSEAYRRRGLRVIGDAVYSHLQIYVSDVNS